MAKENMAQEVASVMRKISMLKDDSGKDSTIYTAEQKTALEEARRCIERLLESYSEVQQDRNTIQQESFASTEFYEEELRKCKEYIRELEMKVQQKEENITSLQKEMQTKLKEQFVTLSREKAEVINKLVAVQGELSSLHKFRAHQLEVEGELQKAKDMLVEQREKEQREKDMLERKYIEQGNFLKREYEKSLNELKAQMEREIEDHVGSKIMHILEDNERLKEELRMHVDVTDGLRKEKSALQVEVSKLGRDLDLLRQAEALHLQRSSTQSRSIAESSNKVYKLEKSLSQLVHQYSAERKELEEENAKKIAALQSEKQTLKRLAQTKMHELKKVKLLAQQVLRERGDVEGFLIESLHHVMEEVHAIKKSQKKQPGKPELRSSLSSLTLGSSSSSKSKPNPCSGSQDLSLLNLDIMNEKQVPILQTLKEVPVKLAPKVDISQLSWEDKERVLRLLFHKIHNAHQIPDSKPIKHNGYELLYDSNTCGESTCVS